LKPTGLSN